MDHIVLRDSDAHLIEEVVTGRHRVYGQRDDGEWLFFIEAREGEPLYEGETGFRSLAQALKVVLAKERLHPDVERHHHRAWRRRSQEIEDQMNQSQSAGIR